MKCIYCQEKAGFFKKICPDCRKLAAAFNALSVTSGYRELLDSLLATEVPTAKIESFLDRDLDGRGSINDQVTARMTNQVMGSLGQPSQMTSVDVKKVRQEMS